VRLAPMRYKNFTWPHNPETFVMEYRRQVAAHKVPFGRCVLQDLGITYRALRGEGVFAGEDAYEQFQALAAVFEEDGPGMLVHPIWRTERAYFAALTVTEEPRPDYVHYRFEFWEDWSGYESGLQENDDGGTAPWTGTVPEQVRSEQVEETLMHIVCKGETLWGIAKQHGVTLPSLIAANPQIKNPNLIYPGDEVRIP